MNDELAFLHAHLADFPEYADEASRNGSDMRVRAFVGLALTSVQETYGTELPADVTDRLDRLIFRSQFSDNAYLKKLGHAHLDDAALARLAHEDYRLVEIATRLGGATPATLPEIFGALEAQFEARHIPLPT